MFQTISTCRRTAHQTKFATLVALIQVDNQSHCIDVYILVQTSYLPVLSYLFSVQ